MYTNEAIRRLSAKGNIVLGGLVDSCSLPDFRLQKAENPARRAAYAARSLLVISHEGLADREEKSINKHTV
jgi:predicted amino acid dehydrogenase